MDRQPLCCWCPASPILLERLCTHSCSQSSSAQHHRLLTSCSDSALLSGFIGMGGHAGRLVPVAASSTCVLVGSPLAMTVFFLVQGVVRSRARRATLSPRPPTSARMRRTVPSLGSRIRHVGSPARCVPILSCRRIPPPHVWAAVMEDTPQAVSPILPDIGHHLCLLVVGVLTSLPM